MSNNSNTIDEQHTEKLNRFYEIENVIIPRLTKEKEKLMQKLKRQRNNSSEKRANNNIDGVFSKKMDYIDQIKKIKEQIKSLKTEKKNYFLNNSKYIFQYFEDKKNISSGTNCQNSNKIKSFFKIKSPPPVTDEYSNEPEFAENGIYNNNSDGSLNQTRKNTSTLDLGIVHKNTGLSNKVIYQKYWTNVKNEIFNIQDFVVSSDICSYCEKGEMIPQDEEGILICNNNKCGKFIPYIIDSCKPSNKEPPVEVSYTAYIRFNHFKEIASQFQAKETTQIPEEVIEAIRNRIKKERIHDLKELNYDKMREILCKLGLSKYFEHIRYINSIFGIKPPIMSEELYETLCVLFIEIQKPWALYCPPNRTNFFNYTYTLYQLFVLLGQTQYLPYIPLMKDRDKQIEQDLIWKKVVGHLGWKFFPTV